MQVSFAHYFFNFVKPIMRHWLIKSEPDVFGLNDLKNSPNKTAPWEGVRNYQARNFMRDEMKLGDRAFFYHSNATPPGIAGIAKVVSQPYADPSQFIAQSEYFDSASKPDSPRWSLVDFQYVKALPRFLSLNELKQHPALADMLILRKGNRLSITPVETSHWDYIIYIANQ
jgi:predicted RNA-binding protein with PUA-like domain